MASATENRLINLYINGQQAGKTLSEIRQKYRRLSAEINRGELSQEEYNQKVKELRRYGQILDQHRDKVRGVNRSWQQFKAVAVGVLGGNLITGALQKITAFIPNMIQQNAKLADSFADVQKTTGLTDAGMEDLNSRLKSIDTRTARSRLLELARDAGKLGITGVDNISQFVKAADQIDVALGEDLGEGAIRQIGKLNNLFKASETFGYEQGMLKLGSVINELGANSEAAEASIVDFTSRLAGVADQADISFESIAAYGATLDSLGQRTETSSTAISQAIVGMFSDTETYAEIAGMGVEEFSQLLNTDANEAFITFLEGLNGNNDGLTAMAERFDQLGIDGSRAITVLGALSSNTDDLRQQQELSNRAFREGISLTQEFAQKNNNAAGNLEKIGRALNRMWVNSSIKTVIDEVTASLADMVEVPVSENLEQQRIRFNGLMFALRDVNTAEETRLQIIKQLNESYGDRLGGIDLETASMQELEQAQMRVNQQYLIEIALQTQREKLKEIGEEIAEVNERRTKASINQGEILTQVNDKLGTSYETVAEAIEDLKDKAVEQYDSGLKRVVQLNEEAKMLSLLREASGSVAISQSKLTGAKKEQAEAMKEQIDLIAQLKKDYPELANIIDAVNSGTPGGSDGTQEPTDGDRPNVSTPTVANGSGEESQTPYEMGLAKLKAAKEEEMLYLEQHRAQGLIDEELFQEEMLGIKISYLTLQKSMAEDMGEETIEIERQLAQAEIQLMEMVQKKAEELATAKKAAAEKEQKAAEASKDAEGKKANAEREAAIAATESAVMRGAAAVSGAETEHEAAVAAINSIRAVIKEQILGAIAAAVAKEIGSKGILGLVTGAAAGALASALFDRIIPPAKMPDPPAFAEGTAFFGGSAIVGDQGREQVNLPLGSSVIPADLTQQILAANAFSNPTPQPSFSAINDGLTFTQSQQEVASGQGGQAAGMDISPLLAEMRAMREELKRSGNKRVVLSQRDYDEFTERKERGESRVRITQR